MEDAATEKPQEKLRSKHKLRMILAWLLLPMTTFCLVFVLTGTDVLPRAPGLRMFFQLWLVTTGITTYVGTRAFKNYRIRTVLLTSALYLPLCLGITITVNFKAVKVEGNSMRPTFLPGDVLLVDLTVGPDERYGVYTLNLEDEDHAHLIKRLVGLPGESMDVRYGRVFADKQEVYPRDGTASDTWNENSPANARFYSGPRDNGDKYFVLGDNPPDSRDSRHFGAINEAAFEGRVVWSLRGSRGFAPID